jgi:exoribonuclease R
MVVSEVMIATKSLLCDFIGQRHGLPMIYRVHERPSQAVRERFHLALNALRIPNSIEDFSNPSQFAGILGSLEQRRDPKSQALLNDLLDTFLLRSLLSTDPDIGHFGINLPRYGNCKPRDAEGLINQQQLNAIYGRGKAFTESELVARSERLNQKRHNRDERVFNAHFLGSLESQLALTDTIATGIVYEAWKDRVTVLMDGFSIPGELLRIPRNVLLEPGAPVVAVVRAFNLEKRCWEFTLKL